MKQTRFISTAVAAVLLTACAGCRWFLPSGTPPPGAIVGPELAPEWFTPRAARNRLVTMLAPRLTGAGAVRPEGEGAAGLIVELAPLTGVRSEANAPLVLRSAISPRLWRVELRRGGVVRFAAELPLRPE